MEKSIKVLSGAFMLVVHIAMACAAIYLLTQVKESPSQGVLVAISMTLILLVSIGMAGFFTLEPGDSRVLILFGSYKGTVKDSGFWYTNPFMVKRKVSQRVRTLNGEKLKVNDSMGNPIEIATVVVWRVHDTFKACFDVDSYEDYVEMQSETALRHSASIFPYDAEDEQISLRKNTQEVGDHLCEELNERLKVAGIEVLESRLSHLAYAPEIAGAMLRRQQAAAVIAARQKIVDGAVGMVEMALARMEREKVIVLDDERKAAMVSNLMVVLCSEQAASPVLNAGTLYN